MDALVGVKHKDIVPHVRPTHHAFMDFVTRGRKGLELMVNERMRNLDHPQQGPARF